MELSHSFGLIAGLSALISYGIFLKEIIKNQLTPNPLSWAVWVVIGLVNMLTYWSVTGHDIWQSLIAIAAATAMFIIFWYAFFKGQLAGISRLEMGVLLLTLSIGLYWQLSGNARTANLLLQVVYIIAFVPTFSVLFKGMARENWPVWTASLFAYFFAILSIAFDPYADWIAFVHPAVNALICNALVFVAVFYKATQSSVTEEFPAINYFEPEVE